MAKKTAKKATKKPAKAVKKKAARKPAAAGSMVVKRRADFGAAVTDYFAKLPPDQHKIALAAHKALLSAAPNLEHTVKWGIAQYVFPGGSMMDAEGFAIYATRQSVNLAVGRGGSLAKKHPLLEGTGKSMRHIKLRTVADARSPKVTAILNDAVALVKGG